MTEVLSLRNLKKSYGKTAVLHDISFSLRAGEILGFIGPNGAGKSTTMKCIAGLENYQGGQIHIMGHDLKKERNKALAHIGLSIETPGLYPHLTGREHLQYFGRLRKLPQSRINEMAAFVRLGKSIEQTTATYSMGMKQRLALALALLHQPDILLLDEPTNGLDPGAVMELRKELLEFKQQGVAILYSGHQLNELERICDRIIFIRTGQLIDTNFIDKMHFRSYSFYFADQTTALAAIQHSFPDVSVACQEDGAIEIQLSSQNTFAAIIKQLVLQNIPIIGIRENIMSLEARYALLYKSGQNDTHPQYANARGI